jgi:hypothetical protein
MVSGWRSYPDDTGLKTREREQLLHPGKKRNTLLMFQIRLIDLSSLIGISYPRFVQKSIRALSRLYTFTGNYGMVTNHNYSFGPGGNTFEW